MTRYGFFLLMLLAAACEPPVKELSAMQNVQYGQRVRYGTTPQWQENESRIVLQYQKPPDADSTVDVHSLLLSFQPSLTNLNMLFRWEIRVGAGGFSQVYEIDAQGSQQITLPAQSFDVALKAVSPGQNFPFVSNAVEVDAMVAVAAGSVSGERATLTEYFDIAPGSQTFEIPVGAVGYRVIGINDPTVATSPFQSTVFFQAQCPASINDRFSGTALQSFHERDDYVPLPGNARNVFCNNSVGNNINGGIMWLIEL